MCKGYFLIAPTLAGRNKIMNYDGMAMVMAPAGLLDIGLDEKC